MFYDASEFRQNLCGWDISPTSTNYDFCTGSYCGGDCSPTSEPTSAPSKIPSDVPSPIPTVKKFLTKSDLQTAVNQYCSNPPSEWVDHPDYDKYG